MSVILPPGLPAIEILRSEGEKVESKYCGGQDSVKILLLNLMPTKQVTETQISRMLASSGITCELFLMNTVTYTSKNTENDYLKQFYHGFDFYKNQFFDGLIVTGAPIEKLDFEQVLYWNELTEIFRWAKEHVLSTYAVCWGAQAALYFYYGINKRILPKKMFGVFKHEVLVDNPILKDISKHFFSPHSRHAEVSAEDIQKEDDLVICSSSDAAGVHIVTSEDLSLICVMGHPEYDSDTLAKEYFRDVEKGETINCPENYFPDNNPANQPISCWREDGRLLYRNWINILAEKKFNHENVRLFC